MYFSARPLLASALDDAYFVNRDDELRRIMNAVAAGLNTLIVGGGGSGKTSLLHQVERALDDTADVRPLFVEGARRAQDAAELLSLIVFQLDRGRERFAHVGDTFRSFGRRPASSPTEALLGALRALRDALPDGARTVVLLDDVPGETAYSLFGQLRDEMWALNAVWLAATRDSEVDAYRRPPASAFFETTVSLKPLSDGDAFNLLHSRAGDSVDPRILRDIVLASDGTPATLIALARATLIEGKKLPELTAARRARDEIALDLGPPAARLVAYLDREGPASASDERLLAELGWSRGRATQVFHDLEASGLVTSSLERRGSSTRPRKVYALLDEPAEPRP